MSGACGVAGGKLRWGETDFGHAVSLRPHDVVARLAEREHRLLLVVAAAFVPVDLAFIIHICEFEVDQVKGIQL